MMENQILNATLLILASYLIGSVPFAVIVSRLMGLNDPRQYGSGNPGATNVLRSGNKLAALLTLLGDALKGWVVVWGVQAFAMQLGADTLICAACALAVFLGHVFSCFLGFKGGKGVATAAGVLFGITPMLGVYVLAIWLAVAFGSRYSSAAAVCAAIASPFLAAWQTGSSAWTVACAAMAAILLWRHTDNIKRLLAGQESRIGSKK